MTPLQRYQQDIDTHGFSKDPEQHKVVMALDALYGKLSQPKVANKKKGFFAKIFSVEAKEEIVPQGLYLWGGVGQGKTYLMDIFYDSLPFEEKIRTHFHRFMQQIHKDLGELNDVVDPLQLVADKLAEKCKVLCFDEFFVSDITDAMLLGRLLTALFDRGVCLVTTSNIQPSGLYKGGLQRARFMPAIAALERNCKVMKLDSGTDYRLRELEQAEIYHYPLDDIAEKNLFNLFEHLSAADVVLESTLEIEGRMVEVVNCAEGVVWFNYHSLCDIPRGSADYIEIARCYHTVLLSDVVVMSDMSNDLANRFINLVDELYDHNVKLIISASVPVLELYQGKKFAFQFERTISRLLEMQSHEYLERPHLP